ncbi:hypothetical protein BC826DRAFT_374532 [Russula brevipes]|nr:hypothetical protein BC826DRAFT_374532 [Russula brevipes]
MEVSRLRISNSPCTAVRCASSSPNPFHLSRADRTNIVYNEDREDGVFTPHAQRHPCTSSPPSKQPSSDFFSSPASSPAGEWNPLDSIIPQRSQRRCWVLVRRWGGFERLTFEESSESLKSLEAKYVSRSMADSDLT